MLLLPTPFTQSIFSVFMENNITLYFTTSITALAILVFIVFRHRIVMNMPYQAMKSALEAMNDIVIKTDLDQTIRMAQGATVGLLGYTETELVGKSLDTIVRGSRALLPDIGITFAKKPGAVSFEADVVTRSGGQLQMDFSFTPVYANEEIVGAVGVGRNITEKKRLEAQFRQAQKMEILGTLAGGVAHDFNNLLTIILAHASMVDRARGDGERATRSLDAIRSAVKRAAGITSQLLMFARKTDAQFDRTDLNQVITDTVGIIESTFPKSITVSVQPGEDPAITTADTNQVSQALLNLCLNAKDALMDVRNGGKEGGTITISTSVVEPAGLRTRFADAGAGRYLHVAVSDDGPGIPDDVKPRLFEPFFSTKEPGKGTGLGLAVVYGVMKNHQGFLDVESEWGRGTTFHLYFPLHHTVAPAQEKASLSVPTTGKGNTLLIVDDEELLLTSLRAVFEDYGYRVFTAKDGEEALTLFQREQDRISLALIDVDIAKTNGVELLLLMRGSKPDLKAIFCTGSVDQPVEGRMKRANPLRVIRKPYTIEEMIRAVAEALRPGNTPALGG
jgi:PAS domain S-box-containing protein